MSRAPPDLVAIRRQLSDICKSRSRALEMLSRDEDDGDTTVENSDHHPGDRRKTGPETKKDQDGLLCWQPSGSLRSVISRWYRVTYECLELERHAEKYFPSLQIFIYQTFNLGDGTSVKVLHLGFDSKTLAGEIDFKKAARIRLPSGKIFTCVQDSELDEEGNFNPVIEKTAVLEGVPEEVVRQPGIIEENFGKYFEFEQPFEKNLKWGSEGSSIYKGKVVLKVKEFKKIPCQTFKLKFRDSVLVVKVRCSGFDEAVVPYELQSGHVRPHPTNNTNQTRRKKDRGTKNRANQPQDQMQMQTKTQTTHARYQSPSRAPKKCFTCKSPEHISKDCPTRKARQFAWSCSSCHNTKYGCTAERCFYEEMARTVTPNMKIAGEKLDPSNLTTLVRNTTTAQTLWCLKNSKTVRDYFMVGEIDTAVDLIHKWVSCKLEQHERDSGAEGNRRSRGERDRDKKRKNKK